MQSSSWTFLTNHAHVLLCISADHSMRLREVADRVGITERAAQRIVRDLCEGGYLTRRRVGRRNHYDVNPELPMRHPVESARQVGALLELLEPAPGR
jgi:DNA-binding MarR family transcriptional regulator